MRISRLMMPALTLAGALALAGCGGGSGTPTTTAERCPTGETGTPPNCVPATNALTAAATAVNTAASQAGALGATSDATAVNAARASLTAAVNAVNALPAAQRGQFSARLNTASGQIRTQELRLARAAGANESDAVEYAEGLRNDLWGEVDIRATGKPSALKDKGADKVTVNDALEGYRYTGRDLDNGNRLRGIALDTQASAKSHPINSNAVESATTGIDIVADNGVTNAGVVSFNADTADINIEGFDDDKTTTIEAGVSVDGKFYGAEGKFGCITGTCEVSSVNGAVSFDNNNVRFTPTLGADAKVAIPDTEYQQLGWWIEEEEGEFEKATLFRNASTGLTPVDLAAIDATTWLNTTATYEGGAAGLYASFRRDNDGKDSGEHGDFTASVELTATFGADANGSTVSGTVDDFKVTNGIDGSNWTVHLLQQGFGTVATSVRILDRSENQADPNGGNSGQNNEWASQVRWESNGVYIADRGGYYVQPYNAAEGKLPEELGGAFRVSSQDANLVGVMAATPE